MKKAGRGYNLDLHRKENELRQVVKSRDKY